MASTSLSTQHRPHLFGLTDPATYRKALYLLLDLPVGIATFTFSMCLVVSSASLAITVVGAPLLALSLLAARGMARAEHVRVRTLLGETVSDAAPAPRGWRRLTDPSAWRAVAYAIVMLPLGIFTSTVALTGWLVAATALTFPAYAPFLDRASVTVGSYTFDGAGWQVTTSVAGAVLLLVMPAVVHALTRLDVAVVRKLLR